MTIICDPRADVLWFLRFLEAILITVCMLTGRVVGQRDPRIQRMRPGEDGMPLLEAELIRIDYRLQIEGNRKEDASYPGGD